MDTIYILIKPITFNKKTSKGCSVLLSKALICPCRGFGERWNEMAKSRREPV